jgi:hypothetical protein
LIVSFMAYIGVLFLFSIVYFLLYKSDPNHFLFNEKIVESQIVSDSTYNSQQTEKLHKSILISESMLINLNCALSKAQNDDFISESYNEGDNIMNRGWILDYYASFNTDDIRLDLNIGTHVSRSGLSSTEKDVHVTMVDSTGQELRDYPNGWASISVDQKLANNFSENKEIILLALRTLVDRYQIVRESSEIELKELLSRRERLYRTYKYADWTYVDFLYFTVVSLPVNTYGDIIPNSRITRVLVSLESIVAWVILIFLVNAKLGGAD